MDIKLLSMIFLSFLLCSTSTAFNITRILSNFPEFGAFNDLLSKSGIADQINSRKTITVLVVNNGSVGELSGKSTDAVQKVLSSHVILDYYDLDKLNNLKKRSTLLTTLYQTSGDANNQEGFLNVTKTDKGVMFGSAVKGAPLVASLERSVAARPYDISVLQVSAVIEVPGIDNVTAAPPPSPAAPAPVAEVNVPSAAPAPAANSPFSSPPEPDTIPSDEAPAPSPTGRSSASSPMHFDGFLAAMLLMVYIVDF